MVHFLFLHLSQSSVITLLFNLYMKSQFLSLSPFTLLHGLSSSCFSYCEISQSPLKSAAPIFRVALTAYPFKRPLTSFVLFNCSRTSTMSTRVTRGSAAKGTGLMGFDKETHEQQLSSPTAVPLPSKANANLVPGAKRNRRRRRRNLKRRRPTKL